MTHPTDPVAAMREACAVRVKQHADMMEDADAEGSTYTSAGIVRKLRRLAVELSSLPLPAAPAHDAVIRASGRNCEVCGKYMGVYRDDDGAAPDLCEACAEVPAHDEVREARERLCNAAAIRLYHARRMHDAETFDADALQRAEVNEWAAYDALRAAERAQRDAGAVGDQRAQGEKVGE